VAAATRKWTASISLSAGHRIQTETYRNAVCYAGGGLSSDRLASLRTSPIVRSILDIKYTYFGLLGSDRGYENSRPTTLSVGFGGYPTAQCICYFLAAHR
jgi:hypothetical protein